jgi:DNA-binding NarL/FixJ family response regulator
MQSRPGRKETEKSDGNIGRSDGYSAPGTCLTRVAFELFAAFVSRAAYAAQESRREVLRANRELQAARALVTEGVRVQERLRLSRELHDIAGHEVARYLGIAVGTVKNHLSDVRKLDARDRTHAVLKAIAGHLLSK